MSAMNVLRMWDSLPPKCPLCDGGTRAASPNAKLISPTSPAGPGAFPSDPKAVPPLKGVPSADGSMSPGPANRSPRKPPYTLSAPPRVAETCETMCAVRVEAL